MIPITHENLSLGSDNHSGIHSDILAAIINCNTEHSPSYGQDPWTESAQKKFKEIFGSNCQAHFVFNGTAANVLAISALIESYNSILCADTSHLHMDECGAPEKLIGTKTIAIPTSNGKLTPEQIEPNIIRMGDQHFSQPKLLSITQPTEVGTVYTLDELKELRDWTLDRNIMLHIDGARLTNAAVFLNCSLKAMTTDIGVDAVSFGGTKNGLLGAEAVLFFQPQNSFKFLRKQYLQLPSKMRFISAQFSTYFTNDLFLKIASHAHKMALYLESKIQECPSVRITQPVQSNAVFAIIPKHWIKPLKKTSFFYVWNESTWEVRWMTTFNSTKNQIDQFVLSIHELEEST